MKKAFSRYIESGGVTCAFAVYHREWDHQHLQRMVRKDFPNGVIRRTWMDRDGKAIMTGWFYENWGA